MTDAANRPRPLTQKDASAIIGILANLEGLILVGDVDENAVEKIRLRAIGDGYLAEGADGYDLRQALNDLNHRVRYALGEYETPPLPLVLPRYKCREACRAAAFGDHSTSPRGDGFLAHQVEPADHGAGQTRYGR